ncbi:aspartic peptidase domain-containing protein [Mycena latifolia]|nr:aspartic peptidase domain-containing protein [Mycena latifolia]
MAPILLLTLCVTVVAASDLVHVPIFRVPGQQPTVDDHVADAERTRIRYSFQSSTGAPYGRRQNLPIVDQGVDSAYYCAISIGTPGQIFNVLVDTAAADLWVADTSCTTGCSTSMPLYNPGVSSSSVLGTSASISYGEETLFGTAATDLVQLGQYSIRSQIFVAANLLPTNLIQGSVSGILGLAFQGTLSPGLPVFQNLLNQLIPGEMSFWLKRFAGTAGVVEEELAGGAFTLGGSNATLYTGEIDFVMVVEPSSTPTRWMVDLSAITVQGKSVPITSGASALATFNPASGLIGGPTSDVAAIWAAVPGSARSSTQAGFFQFPCSTKLNVDVSFGGRSWPINPVDLNLGPISTGNSQCFGAIFELSTTLSQTSPNWVFGAAFLKNVYMVLRANPFSVGFAQLSSVALGASPTTVSTALPSFAGSPIAGAVVGFIVLVVISVLVWRACWRRSTNRTKTSTTTDAPTDRRTEHPSLVQEKSPSSAGSPGSTSPHVAPLAYTNRDPAAIGDHFHTSQPNSAGRSPTSEAWQRSSGLSPQDTMYDQIVKGNYIPPSTATTMPSPTPNAMQFSSALGPQAGGSSPTSYHSNSPNPYVNRERAAAGSYFPSQMGGTVPSPTSEALHQSSAGPAPQGAWPQGNHTSTLTGIQEVPRGSDADTSTTPIHRGTRTSFSSVPTTTPDSPNLHPDGPSVFPGAPSPPTTANSTSMMKHEQNAAAHHYGAGHTASNVFVHTSNGLQLSPGLMSARMVPSGSAGHEISAEAANNDHEDLPPMYSRYEGV